MKTKLLLVAGVILMHTASFGQAFQKGKSYASVGYSYQAFNAVKLFSINATAGLNVSGLGPATLKYEYAVSDKVGVGISAAYSMANVSWTDVGSNGLNYNYKYTWSKMTFTPRFNFHFGDDEHFDPYFGIGLGYKNSGLKSASNDPNFIPFSLKGLPMSMETVFGGRYLFSDNFGAFAEIGIGHGFITGGFVLKL